jgi:YHS domain-containing protein
MSKIAAFLCLSMGLAAGVAQERAREVLEGLDPVLLTQGKEVAGKNDLSIERGGFLYRFSSAETRAAFAADPARYEIQLGGVCARMGGMTGGNPDAYFVHQGKIYIFGSTDCYKAFTAAPERYLEPARKPPEATPAALARGRDLVRKAVGAHGGAAALDRLSTYREESMQIQKRRDGTEFEIRTVATIAFPDRVRQERIFASGTAVMVVAAGEAFGIFRQGSFSVRPAAAENAAKEFQRTLVFLLKACTAPALRAVATGRAKAGETAVEQVAVEAGGLDVTLGIDPDSGRILSVAFVERGPEGNYGNVLQVFSDFRPIEGVTLPFRLAASFNGEPDPSRSSVATAITLNAPIDPLLFTRPAAAAR